MDGAAFVVVVINRFDQDVYIKMDWFEVRIAEIEREGLRENLIGEKN